MLVSPWYTMYIWLWLSWFYYINIWRKISSADACHIIWYRRRLLLKLVFRRCDNVVAVGCESGDSNTVRAPCKINGSKISRISEWICDSNVGVSKDHLKWESLFFFCFPWICFYHLDFFSLFKIETNIKYQSDSVLFFVSLTAWPATQRMEYAWKFAITVVQPLFVYILSLLLIANISSPLFLPWRLLHGNLHRNVLLWWSWTFIWDVNDIESQFRTVFLSISSSTLT